jgi:rhodanese-related sulfurtransferase
MDEKRGVGGCHVFFQVYEAAFFVRLPYTDSMLDYEIVSGEAAALVREGKARLIDVREPWEFETARIEGSVPMPMGDVPARAHQELDPEERLVVVCHHGMRSMNVTVWLRNQGFELAQSLRGGIDAWSVEMDAKVPRY